MLGTINELFFKLPAVQTLLAEQGQQRLDERRAAAAALDAIERQEGIDAAKARKDFATADGKVKAAEAALQKLIRDRNAIKGEIHNIGARAEAARRQHRQFLAEENDDEVIDWIEKFLEELQRLRSSTVAEAEHVARIDGRGNPQSICVASNRESISERLRAVVAACHAADRLKYTSADAASELQKLWDSLPVVEMRRVDE